jgi:hypothetical protein
MLTYVPALQQRESGLLIFFAHGQFAIFLTKTKLEWQKADRQIFFLVLLFPFTFQVSLLVFRRPSFQLSAIPVQPSHQLPFLPVLTRPSLSQASINSKGRQSLKLVFNFHQL